MQKIIDMNISQLQKMYDKKELTAVEVVNAYLQRIDEKEPAVKAFLTITAESALKKAVEIDAARQAGTPLSALAGIPMALKDNICTKGVRTTCASKMLADFTPPYDATVCNILSDSILLGKLNMDEFAMGASTETSFFQKTHNPYNLDKVPGGSSGGSAAVVAANEALFSLGSDTGGSVRQPAAFCGVVGMKPTYGLVSRHGLVAFASSFDQIGPITRTVTDSALVLNAIAVHDKKDSTSFLRHTTDYTSEIGKDVTGMRIALPQEFFGAGLQTEVEAALQKTAQQYERAGAIIEEVSLPHLEEALAAYYILSSAEASSNLARYDGIKYGHQTKKADSMESLRISSRNEGFGAEVKRRIMLGTFVLSAGYCDAYYKKALQARTLVAQDFDAIFSTCDMILAPVFPTTAFSLGEKKSPLECYLADIYTVPVNIAGLPALSFPVGLDHENLPIGLQLIGPRESEAALYSAAYFVEQIR
ncbi:MAG: Asp-tRNA(Asn)/Glu-tRNA(Gln) amidotransferase subunit GatA [Christensenellaceae bacterium]|jgi:aspartyl-tRNA(Asn)/glutamyl-tRNA(Gln) amidotransferase subunit A